MSIKTGKTQKKNKTTQPQNYKKIMRGTRDQAHKITNHAVRLQKITKPLCCKRAVWPKSPTSNQNVAPKPKSDASLDSERPAELEA